MPSLPARASDILRVFRSGSSLPALVETEEGPFVVKWRGIGDGPTTNAIDWICLHLAAGLGLSVPRPKVIEIPGDMVARIRNDELRGLVRASLGLNLGLEYLAGANPYRVQDLDRVPKKERDLIFLVDVLVLNIDRIDHNPNMLMAGGRLFSLDFTASLGIKSLLTGKSYDTERSLARLRRHPFYTDTPDAVLPLEPDCRERFAAAVADMPLDWLDPDPARAARIQTRLPDLVLDLIDRAPEIVRERLAALKNIPLETPEQARARGRDNLALFKKKAGLV